MKQNNPQIKELTEILNKVLEAWDLGFTTSEQEVLFRQAVELQIKYNR